MGQASSSRSASFSSPGAIASDSELTRQVEFLQAQNRMLRRRAKKVRLHEAEKRLLVWLG